MKICRVCGLEKPLSEFYSGKARCKDCYGADQRTRWAARTPEQRRLRVRQMVEWQRTPAGKANNRRGQLKHRYNLTQVEYDEMLAGQDGGCALCKVDTPSPKKHFSVDHDHATGRVRGLLCLRCNSNLGWLESLGLDSVEAYLYRGLGPAR